MNLENHGMKALNLEDKINIFSLFVFVMNLLQLSKVATINLNLEV